MHQAMIFNSYPSQSIGYKFRHLLLIFLLITCILKFHLNYFILFKFKFCAYLIF